jgi:circadian clock protein KaiC
MTTETLRSPASVDGADPLFPRQRTGNPQLDEVLGGGFPANSINILMGQPGTGKTILAEQLLFSAATEGNSDRPMLYITTLSEPMTKVVSYVQRFSFFDVGKIGTHIVYEDLGALLAREGPSALCPWMTQAIKTVSPRIIVIDSFRAIHDLSTSIAEMRRLVSDLAAVFSAYDTTVFLLGEYTQADVDRYPEFAVADAIVELARQPLGTRDERFLRVLKLRGSGYREGQHAFRITSAGIDLFPRLVGPTVFEGYVASNERVSTGVDGLDAMVDGGIWRGSTTLVVGPTGAGKTTLGLQFALEGIRQGEPTLIVNFQENPVQLRRAMKSLGFKIEADDERKLHLRYASPVELQIDSIIGDIFDHIRLRGVRRVVIDAVGDLAAAASDAQRLHDYLYSLVQHFTVRGITSFLTFESGDGVTGGSLHEQRFSYMSDNVLQIGLKGETETVRTLRVVKTRHSGHDPVVRVLEIGHTGARVISGDQLP